jgi:hypothetical protein
MAVLQVQVPAVAELRVCCQCTPRALAARLALTIERLLGLRWLQDAAPRDREAAAWGDALSACEHKPTIVRIATSSAWRCHLCLPHTHTHTRTRARTCTHTHAPCWGWWRHRS